MTGLAIVLADRATIFVDGRYTLAVRAQVDTSLFTPLQVPEQSPDAWIAAICAAIGGSNECGSRSMVQRMRQRSPSGTTSTTAL